MQIFKYRLPEPGTNEVMMPAGAVVLTTAEQGNYIYVWAKVDPDAKLEPRRFYAAVTGEDLGVVGDDHRYRFVGTAFLGVFVIHVFVERRFDETGDEVPG